MTRRRRRASSGDSLELLLDTICNTFGGIVFIALLIVLLLRETAARPAVEADGVPTPDEIERIAGRLEEVAAELSSLRTAQIDLARRAAAFAPDDVRELLERKNVLASQAAELRADRDRFVAENALSSATLQRKDVELEARIAELPAARKRASRLEQELETVRRSKTKEIRNPIVRDASAFRSVGLVVRYGRMYVWHRYDTNGERLGLNTDDFVVVETRVDGIVTHPDPTRGIPLTPGEATIHAIRERLQTFPSSSCYVEVVVRPDSFEQFAILRDALIAAGYEYRLIPSNSSIVDRGGSDGKVQ